MLQQCKLTPAPVILQSNDVFGTSGLPFNARSQYRSCSAFAVPGHASLDLVPATGSGIGTGASAGTMEVTINAIVETYSLGQLVAAAEPLINGVRFSAMVRAALPGSRVLAVGPRPGVGGPKDTARDQNKNFAHINAL